MHSFINKMNYINFLLIELFIIAKCEVYPDSLGAYSIKYTYLSIYLVYCIYLIYSIEYTYRVSVPGLNEIEENLYDSTNHKK